MKKTIFVTGATGQQGKSLINALREENDDYHILALTRDKTSPTAQHLDAEKHVTVVEGDLNDRASIECIFKEALVRNDRIWGVFAVLAFPGLGKVADAEEAQGKIIADIALEYGVSAFIYSSAIRSGPRYDDQQRLSGRSKVLVEQHVKALGPRGLPWVIVRPGFFMENFSGMLGSLTFAVMQAGLKPEIHLDLVAAADIGKIATAIYKNFDDCRGKELVLVSDSLTSAQISHVHAQSGGNWSSYMWWPLAKLTLATNSEIQNLTRVINDCYCRRMNGEYPEYEEESRISREICPERISYQDWISETRAQQKTKGNWNRVNIWDILTGKS